MERNATEGRNIHCDGCQQETSGLYANRSSQIVTGGKEDLQLPSVCLENPITCSMGLRSEIVPANPYVQYPHSLRAVRQLLCDDMKHCRP
ncbi:hypothetical protein TNCV_198851 [Trichonephila clavipes]|nr:hypothetical protein TNCV_198851 [Trichonephila clavipes]